MKFFEEHSKSDFLRTGGIAEDTVILDEGSLPQFSHAMEPQLRKLGMPTELKKGVINLLQDYTVCKEGDTLTSEQAQILKLFGHQQAEFKLNMVAVWTKEDGKFKMLREDFKDDNDEDNEDEENNEEMSEWMKATITIKECCWLS